MLIQSRAATCKNYNWYSGKSSSCVKNIQRITNAAGARHWHYSGSAVIATDGIFGPKTKAQVISFQRYTKISQDGIVGPVTWAQLCRYAGLLGSSNDGYKAAVSSGCVYSTPKSTTASTPKPTATQKPTAASTSKPTTTSTQSSTPTGTPTWRGDYQTGNFSQWSEQQLFRSAQQQIVTSPARAGFPRTARFEVNSRDITSGDAGRNRSEVADYDSGHPTNGQTMWWAWSMYLPAGFHLDSGQWMATTQWHTTSDTGGYGSGVALMLNAGVPRISYNATSSVWTDSQPLPLGRWNDFRVGILWRDNSSGHITIRMNGRTIVDSNAQTLQPGQSTYFKQGVYRSASSQTHVLYYTATRRGPTEASVSY